MKWMLGDSDADGEVRDKMYTPGWRGDDHQIQRQAIPQRPTIREMVLWLHAYSKRDNEDDVMMIQKKR